MRAIGLDSQWSLMRKAIDFLKNQANLPAHHHRWHRIDKPML
jgi:hypothetical protein